MVNVKGLFTLGRLYPWPRPNRCHGTDDQAKTTACLACLYRPAGTCAAKSWKCCSMLKATASRSNISARSWHRTGRPWRRGRNTL